MYHTLHVLLWLCCCAVSHCVAVILLMWSLDTGCVGRVKDSLTHRPGSQGWAPGVLLSCHVMCICVCVFCMDILGFVYICWWWFLFLFLSTYGWYAMFMPLRSLVDTGTQISVIPATPSYRKNAWSDLVLQAVNNSPIRTYATRSLTLNLGLHRTFRWLLVIADITTPILRADFLQHYSLSVDLSRYRLGKNDHPH